MIFRYFSQYEPRGARELIAGGLRSLKVDWEINVKRKTFEEFPGKQLTFEEFIMMLLIEKDFALAAAGVKGQLE